MRDWNLSIISTRNGSYEKVMKFWLIFIFQYIIFVCGNFYVLRVWKKIIESLFYNYQLKFVWNFNFNDN